MWCLSTRGGMWFSCCACCALLRRGEAVVGFCLPAARALGTAPVSLACACLRWRGWHSRRVKGGWEGLWRQPIQGHCNLAAVPAALCRAAARSVPVEVIVGVCLSVPYAPKGVALVSPVCACLRRWWYWLLHSEDCHCRAASCSATGESAGGDGPVVEGHRLCPQGLCRFLWFLEEAPRPPN